jgi:hypothetical protein
LFFNNFVMRNCGEPLDPDATLPLRVGEGLGCRFFPLSITVDMPRNA